MHSTPKVQKSESQQTIWYSFVQSVSICIPISIHLDSFLIIASRSFFLWGMHLLWLESGQQYLTELASVPQEAPPHADTKLVVIGCGEWRPIHHILGEMLTPPQTNIIT